MGSWDSRARRGSDGNTATATPNDGAARGDSVSPADERRVATGDSDGEIKCR